MATNLDILLAKQNSATPAKKSTSKSNLDLLLEKQTASKNTPVTSQEIASLQAELAANPVKSAASPVVSTVAPGMGQFNSFLTGTGRIAAVPTVEPPAPVTITTTSGLSPQTTKTQEAFGIPMSTWEASNPGSEQPIPFVQRNLEYLANLPKQTWEAIRTAQIPFNETIDALVKLGDKSLPLKDRLSQLVTKDVPKVVKDQAAVLLKALAGLGGGATMGIFDIQHGNINVPFVKDPIKSAANLDVLFKNMGVDPMITNETGLEGTSQLVGNLASLKGIEGLVGKIPVGAKATLGDVAKTPGLIGAGARAAQMGGTGAVSGTLTPGATNVKEWLNQAGSGAAMFAGMSVGGDIASRLTSKLANAQNAAKFPSLVKTVKTPAGTKFTLAPALEKSIGTVAAAASGVLAASPFGGDSNQEFADQLVLGLAMQLFHKKITPLKAKEAIKAQVEAERVKAAQDKVPTQEQPVADIPPPVAKEPPMAEPVPVAPIRGYHGTDAEFAEIKTDGLGAHFTVSEKTAKRFGNRVIEADLNIKNPLRIKEHGGSHDQVSPELIKSLEDAGALPKGYYNDELVKRILVEGNLTGDALEKAFYAKHKPELEKIKTLLQSQGYDGIVYRNTAEGGGDSYIVFDPGQVRQIPAESTPASPQQRKVKSSAAVDIGGLEAQIEAKKNPDGSYRLFFRGTRNEIFPGEKFTSAQEARQYWKAERAKLDAISNPIEKDGITPPPSIESLTPGGETVIGEPPVKKSKATLESAKGHASKATEAAKSALKELFADSERGSISPKDASEKAARIRQHLETLWSESKAAGKDFAQWVEEVVAEFGEAARSHAMALQPKQKEEAGQKQGGKKPPVSKLRTNTIERSTEIPQEIKDKMLREDYEYAPETNQGQREEAVRNIEANRAAVEARLEDKARRGEGFNGTEQAEVHALYMERQAEAMKTGDFNEVTSFMMRMRPSMATTHGQALQALNAHWPKMTPEGAVKNLANNVADAQAEIAKKNPVLVKEAKTEAEILAERIAEIDRAEADSAKAAEAKARFIREHFGIPEPEATQPKPAPKPRQPKATTPKPATSKVTAKQVFDNFRAANKDLAAGLDALFGGAQRGSISPEPATFAEKYAQAKPLFEKAWSEFKAAGKDFNHMVNEFVKHHGEGVRAYLLRFKADVVAKERNREQLEKRLTEPPKKKPRKNLADQVLWCIENNVYDDAALARLVNLKRGIPELTPDVVRLVSEQMQIAQNLPEGRAKRAAIWRAQYTIASQLPVSMRQKLRGVLRVTLLSNPKTFIRNIGGNVVIGAMEGIRENTVGALVDWATSRKTGQRTTLAAPIKKGKAFFEGVGIAGKEMKQDIAEKVDTSTTRSMAEMPTGRTFNNPVLNALEGFVGKLLQVGDRPFFEGWRRSRIEELKKINKTNEVTEDMELNARLYALDKVFQNDSALAARARKMRESFGILGEFVMPFVQTPANIFDKLIDYSPAGLVRGVLELGKVKKGTFDQKLFVDRLSRGLMGSGIMVLGYVLAKKGILTGAPSDDKDEREFKRNTGWQPYAIKLGNSYYTYDWMQPAGGMLAAGADFFVSGKEKPGAVDRGTWGRVMKGLLGAGDTLLNQSFLQGIVTMFSGYSVSEGVLKTLENAPLMFLPTGAKQLAQTVDPYIRDASTFTNKAAAKIPGASFLAPEKLDAFGKPIKSYQGRSLLSKLPEIFISPGNFSKLDNSPVVKMVRDLVDRTGEVSHVPRVAPTTMELPGGKKIPLTPEQRNAYQEIAGKLTLARFTPFVQKKMTDADRVKALAGVLTGVAKDTKRQFLTKYKAEILKGLTPEQRKAFLSYLNSGSGGFSSGFSSGFGSGFDTGF